MPAKYLIDTNILLRVLLQDDRRQAIECQKILERADSGEFKLELHASVLSEVVWVLESKGFAHDKISEELTELIGKDCFFCQDKQIVICALEKYENTKLEFTDCLLACTSQKHQATLISYDKKLRAETSAITPSQL